MESSRRIFYGHLHGLFFFAFVVEVVYLEKEMGCLCVSRKQQFSHSYVTLCRESDFRKETYYCCQTATGVQADSTKLQVTICM